MKHIITSNNIILFDSKNQTHKISNTDPRFDKILRVIENDQEVENILTGKFTISDEAIQSGFEIRDSVVYYKGYALPNVLSDYITEMLREGISVKIFEAFWENLIKNPSKTAVEGLYDFLAYKSLPLTEDGCFLAYKGVDTDFWSIRGNSDTTVLQGRTSSLGKIFNGIGEIIEVARNSVSDDRDEYCAEGVHAGSLDYAKDYIRGQGRLVIVKINPVDVVSIPKDCECQKLRCCKYQVIAEFERELTESATDHKGEAVISKTSQLIEQETKDIERIKKYISKRITNNSDDRITLRQIGGIFSPIRKSSSQLKILLKRLNIDWNIDDNNSEYLVGNLKIVCGP